MGDFNEWMQRTFVPESINSMDKGEEKRRASTVQEEKTREATAAAEATAKAAKEEVSTAAMAAEKAVNERRKKIIKGSQSIYTSPLGLSETATTARKVLLGR